MVEQRRQFFGSQRGVEQQQQKQQGFGSRKRITVRASVGAAVHTYDVQLPRLECTR